MLSETVSKNVSKTHNDMKTTKAIQWTVFSVLFTVGFLAFMVLAGEDDPSNPLPIGEWFLIKLSAMAVIGLCVLVGKWLNAKGLIPEISEEDDEI